MGGFSGDRARGVATSRLEAALAHAILELELTLALSLPLLLHRLALPVLLIAHLVVLALLELALAIQLRRLLLALPLLDLALALALAIHLLALPVLALALAIGIVERPPLLVRPVGLGARCAHRSRGEPGRGGNAGTGAAGGVTWPKAGETDSTPTTTPVNNVRNFIGKFSSNARECVRDGRD